eukprot:2149469-Amphidinium_carterae.1
MERDEIFQCDETTGNALDDNVKMTILLNRNRLKGAMQNHFLLNIDMTKPDFDKAEKAVEDCYRHVYSENDYTTNINAFKGKKGQGKGKYNFKGQDRNPYDTQLF